MTRSNSAGSSVPLLRRLCNALRVRCGHDTALPSDQDRHPEQHHHGPDFSSSGNDTHADLGTPTSSPPRAQATTHGTLGPVSSSRYSLQRRHHDHPVLSMAFRSHQPNRRSTKPPSSSPSTTTACSPHLYLPPRPTGPKTPISVIERERFLQPADRRNLDLAPYYNPFALSHHHPDPPSGAEIVCSRSLPHTARAPRRSTPGAAQPTSSWFEGLMDDEVQHPPRYGDRRQSRRMRPDEMRDLEQQLEHVLAVDRLGSPPVYQRVTVYV